MLHTSSAFNQKSSNSQKMEFTFSLLFWCSALLLATLLQLSKRQSQKTKQQQPPGPRGWPIIGNILDLGAMPHQTLYKLRPKYGPILWLKLGSMNTIAVQSAKAAEQLFKNHDLSFCDRKCLIALTSQNYNQGSVAVNQYGPYWRVMRRLCNMELLVNKRIVDTAPIRGRCVDAMIQFIQDDSAAKRSRGEAGAVNLAHYLFLTSFNVVGNLVFSRDLLDPQCREGNEFFHAMDNIMNLAGKPNVADFLPLLKWLDPQGVKRNMTKHMKKAMEIAGKFVKERVEEKKSGRLKSSTKEFLDVLLEYESDGKEGPDKISNHNINIIVLEMFLAGSETTSSTIEWAMAELLRRPELMQKAKEELNRVVGPKRKVEERDMDNLPYLQAVVKETLRLHPPIPLLLPRNALEDTKFMGYLIPKDTQIFVNVWGIGRDPESWDEPLCFKPERFIGSNIEYKGQNYELLPFGSGRRICVGMSLGQRMVHLALASLLHSFDWKIVPEALDMSERMGITLRKLAPLEAIPLNPSL
ncbi:iridoid oxidase [Ziziphus jujuba]|uniref:Iridoid oxidase n=1 Tax=Ziziphus jujuba TaxID=326968 RepID=A0A6P4B8E5_ZIZJJ|nr:iridoid oxidase [Ziziphus jujuba]